MRRKLSALLLATLMLAGCSQPEANAPEDSTASASASESELPYYGTTARTRATLPEPEIEESALIAPEPPEITFEGFELSELGESPELGNIGSNLGAWSHNGIVCVDEVSGCTYITAVGYDNKLHKFVDGKDAGVLLDKTVWGMNMLDGMLYCLIDSAEPVHQMTSVDRKGDIYRIDPDTGEAELILDTDAASLIIADGVLYYTSEYFDENDTLCYESRSCAPDGSGDKALGYHIIGFCGKYRVISDEESSGYPVFFDPETGERISFTAKRNIACFMVSDGKAYYAGGDVMELDLATGKERKLQAPQEFCYGYAKLGEDVYSFFWKCHITNLEYPRERVTKFWTYYETTLYKAMNADVLSDGDRGYYASVFTDGSRIYTVKSNLSADTFMLIGFKFDHENNTCEEVYIL